MKKTFFVFVILVASCTPLILDAVPFYVWGPADRDTMDISSTAGIRYLHRGNQLYQWDTTGFSYSRAGFLRDVVLRHSRDSVINYSSIEAALAQARSGDLIEIAPGTYSTQVAPNGKTLTFLMYANTVITSVGNTITIAANDSLYFIGAGKIRNTGSYALPCTTLVQNGGYCRMDGIVLESDTNTVLAVKGGTCLFSGEVQRIKDKYSARPAIVLTGGILQGSGNIQSATRDENQRAFFQSGGELDWTADVINGGNDSLYNGIARIRTRVYSCGPGAIVRLVHLTGAQKLSLTVDSFYTQSGDGFCAEMKNTSSLRLSARCFRNPIYIRDAGAMEMYNTSGEYLSWIYLGGTDAIARIYNSYFNVTKVDPGGVHAIEIGQNTKGALEMYNSTFCTGRGVEATFVGSPMDARGEVSIHASNCRFIQYGSGGGGYPRCVALHDTASKYALFDNCAIINYGTDVDDGGALNLKIPKTGKRFNVRFVNCYFHAAMDACVGLDSSDHRLGAAADTLALIDCQFSSDRSTGEQYVSGYFDANVMRDSIAHYSSNFSASINLGKQEFYGNTYFRSLASDSAALVKITSPVAGYTDVIHTLRIYDQLVGRMYGNSLMFKLGTDGTSRLYDASDNEVYRISASSVDFFQPVRSIYSNDTSSFNFKIEAVVVTEDYGAVTSIYDTVVIAGFGEVDASFANLRPPSLLKHVIIYSEPLGIRDSVLVWIANASAENLQEMSFQVLFYRKTF